MRPSNYPVNDEPPSPSQTSSLQAHPPVDLRPEVDAAFAQWTGVAAALSPIIGQGGVAALFRRALSLRMAEHGFLAAARTNTPQQADGFDEFRAILHRQSPATAVAAHRALMKTFFDLLGALIGTALAERLIGFSHAPLSIYKPKQEASP